MDTSTVVVKSTDTLGRRITPRRHRTIEEKRAIVAESLAPRASVAEVARRHGLNANLLFIWRRLQERGLLETHTRRMRGRRLVPVKLLAPGAAGISAPPSGMLRIELPSGVQLHVCPQADIALLERVIELLRR